MGLPSVNADSEVSTKISKIYISNVVFMDKIKVHADNFTTSCSCLRVVVDTDGCHYLQKCISTKTTVFILEASA